jgi:hypothetical protein
MCVSRHCTTLATMFQSITPLGALMSPTKQIVASVSGANIVTSNGGAIAGTYCSAALPSSLAPVFSTTTAAAVVASSASAAAMREPSTTSSFASAENHDVVGVVVDEGRRLGRGRAQHGRWPPRRCRCEHTTRCGRGSEARAGTPPAARHCAISPTGTSTHCSPKKWR